MDLEPITIRYEWHPPTARWNYSIVDVIDNVIDSADARNYWKVLKNRLKKRGNAIADSCNQLKMRARDGKLYNTDTADAHSILQIMCAVSDTPPLHILVWIHIKEATIPQQKPSQLTLSEKSYPQIRKLRVDEITKQVNRNRLRDFFKMEVIK